MRASYIVLIIVLTGVAAGFFGAFLFNQFNHPSEEELIKDFYYTENAVHISPHSLRKSMTTGNNYILVDLRSQQEYETEHITGAINIPAYSDPNTSAYGDVERIVSSFKELQEANPGKDIVTYCYSMPCMTGRKIGKMLVEHDIYVKTLGIGWNEWRYYWNLWNHELEWDNTNVNDYITKGSEPGKFNTSIPSNACPIGGEFGC